MQIERLSNRKIFVQEVFLSAKELQNSPFYFSTNSLFGNEDLVWRKKRLKKFKTDIND